MIPTNEHESLRKIIRDFAEKEIKPVAAELDEKEVFSVELANKMGEMGLFGVFVPEEYEGQGMDYLSYIICVEELARVDSSQAATIAAHNSLGIGPILYFGTEEQKRKFIPQLCTGKALWGFGLTEPEAGSDSRGTKTKGVKEGTDWVINGSKVFITNASSSISKGVTVQFISEKGKYSTILMETATEGFESKTMKNKMMWRSSDTAELFFDDCRVPEENILGKLGQGSKIMLSTLDKGRLSIAAMGLGLAQGAFEMALEYANNRKQFGKTISKFQGISFKLAEMATRIELSRNMLYKACYLKDNGKDFHKESAMAKYYCSETAKFVADEAVQIHGGYGLMKHYDIERFYRDQRILQIGEGTSEILKIVIARAIGCK